MHTLVLTSGQGNKTGNTVQKGAAHDSSTPTSAKYSGGLAGVTFSCLEELYLLLEGQEQKTKNGAPPGNRTRVARMGISHDTITPAVQVLIGHFAVLHNTVV